MATGTWGGATDVKPMQVKISWMVGLNTQQTGFHLRREALGFDNLNEVAEDVSEWVNTHFRTLLTTTDRLVGIDVVDLASGTGGGFSFSNVYGTLDAGALAAPAFLMVPVSFKGTLRRRYGQGRGLWPVRSEGHTTAEVLTAPAQAAFQAVADALIDRYVDTTVPTGLRMVNVHGVLPPKLATASRPARPEIPATWYDVATVRVGGVLSFLRSRKAGQGS